MNKVRFGLKNAYYAPATIAADGTATYGTPIRLPGAVSIAMEPTGENVVFRADDVDYFTLPGAAGYQGDLTVAMIPDDFKKDCLGEVESTDGIIVEKANAVPAPFALLFEFTGDESAIRHVFYKCTAKRVPVSGQTKGETPEVATESITINASTIYNDTIKDDIVKSRAGSTATAYSTWYTTVHQP